jgi:hypothetical protein
MTMCRVCHAAYGVHGAPPHPIAGASKLRMQLAVLCGLADVRAEAWVEYPALEEQLASCAKLVMHRMTAVSSMQQQMSHDGAHAEPDSSPLHRAVTAMVGCAASQLGPLEALSRGGSIACLVCDALLFYASMRTRLLRAATTVAAADACASGEQTEQYERYALAAVRSAAGTLSPEECMALAAEWLPTLVQTGAQFTLQPLLVSLPEQETWLREGLLVAAVVVQVAWRGAQARRLHRQLAASKLIRLHVGIWWRTSATSVKVAECLKSKGRLRAVGSNVAHQKHLHEALRRRRLRELRDTERSYVLKLGLLVRLLVVPLLRAADKARDDATVEELLACEVQVGDAVEELLKQHNWPVSAPTLEAAALQNLGVMLPYHRLLLRSLMQPLATTVSSFRSPRPLMQPRLPECVASCVT